MSLTGEVKEGQNVNYYVESPISGDYRLQMLLLSASVPGCGRALEAILQISSSSWNPSSGGTTWRWVLCFLAPFFYGNTYAGRVERNQGAACRAAEAGKEPVGVLRRDRAFCSGRIQLDSSRVA